jgi:hypothetical protein
VGILFFLLQLPVAFLDDVQSDTLLAREGDEGLGLSEDEDIGCTGGKSVADSVLKMDNIEASIVLLFVFDGTDATQVTSAGDHCQSSRLKRHIRFDLVGDKVEFDGIAGFDEGIGVANGASIVRDDMGHSALSDFDSLDFEELVLSFLAGNSVNLEATLGIVEKTEALVGALNLNDIHEASRIFDVSADLSVDLNEALSGNGNDLPVGQGILQSVSEEKNQRKAFPKFVGTGGWTRSPNSTKFVQHPMFWGG